MSTTTPTTAAAAGTITIGGDLTVNRLGYGAMRITGPGVWQQPQDPQEARRVLKRLPELDVNFIDTADSYGPDVSEQLIGETLYPYPSDMVIATKGGLVRPGPGDWRPNGHPDHLREALEGSLRRLRVDRIDVYQFHRPDPQVPFEESVGALAELQKQGKIRHIGLSNVSVDQLRAAQQITPIVSVQNRYNIEDRESEDVLKACEQQGIAFIPWFPLAAGESWQKQALEQVAQRHGVAAGQVAIAWLLHHSPVMLPIPGTSKVSHLEENVASAALQLTDEDMRQLGE